MYFQMSFQGIGNGFPIPFFIVKKLFILRTYYKIAISWILVFSIYAPCVSAQVTILDDDFSESGYPSDPPWSGDTSDLLIFIDDSGNHMLRLQAEQAGSTIITTPSEAAFGVWEFFIRQDFTPSNSNFSYIFLMADRADLDDNVNGYAVRTGESGSPKRFRLFRFTDGNAQEIITGRTEISETEYRLKVERNQEGEWKLFVSEGFHSEPVLDSEPVVDVTHNYSSHFGMQLTYTTTRVDRFYFDDIKVQADLLPFQPVSVDVLTGNNLLVSFNHLLNPGSLQPDRFVLNGLLNPDSAGLSEPHQAELNFENPINEGPYRLTVNSIYDRFGNLSDPGKELFFEVNNPFFIVNAVATDNRSIELKFSESVDQESVTDENVILLSGQNPNSFSFIAPDILRLNFNRDLPAGENLLIVNDIAGQSGWKINPDTEISLIKFDEFETGDILINEFMYSPPEDFPAYVELFNRSGKFLNFQNWRLQRRQVSTEPIRIITDREFLIEPQSYVVISDDTTSLRNIYGDRNWLQADNFPRFNIATNDEIRIFAESGELADSLQYLPSAWGGNGVALERLSPDVPARFSENWSESPNPLLGTPGIPNEAVIDRFPPSLEEMSVTDDGRFLLTFSKRLDAEIASDPFNYTISPSPGISLVIVDNNRVTLVPDSELTDDTIYAVTVENLEDLFGNRMNPATAFVRFFEFGLAKPGDLVINEILYRSVSGGDEFVEIRNRSNHTINLSSWQIGSGNRTTVIEEQAYIKGGDLAVLTKSGESSQPESKLFPVSGFPSFRISGDAVLLKDPEGVTIDSLFYQPDWGGQTPGNSLERRDPRAISTDPANWSSSQAAIGSTPAEKNSVFEIDVTPPTPLFATYSPEDNQIEIRFSEFVDLNNETRFILNGTELKSNSSDNISVIHLEANSLQDEIENNMKIENVSDFQGNISQETSLIIAHPLVPGSVVINEIMFDPIRDNFDNLPDQSEYIEIMNRSLRTISLEGITLHDQTDENNEVRKMIPVSSVHKQIPPGEYVLLYADNTNERFNESGNARFFELNKEFTPFAIRFDRATLSLSLSGRPIFLADSTGMVIDYVNYSGDWHNPNLIDTKGISLERINPEMQSNEPANWGSSASGLGGTPLRQNSLFQTPSLETPGIGVTLEPNPFSPDGDGRNDNLIIRYQLDEPDYMMRIRIYDRYGRLIRKLVDSQVAGFEGTLLWDGLRDNGQHNRIGIYIILFEAFNSSNGSNRKFKETVVIARNFR